MNASMFKQMLRFVGGKPMLILRDVDANRISVHRGSQYLGVIINQEWWACDGKSSWSVWLAEDSSDEHHAPHDVIAEYLSVWQQEGPQAAENVMGDFIDTQCDPEALDLNF